MMRNLRKCNILIKRCYTQSPGISKTPGSASASPASATASPASANVKGLTSNCVRPTTEPVGPGAAANSHYKVPEYFCFNRFSFAEAEIEMASYRCPQPSALKK